MNQNNPDKKDKEIRPVNNPYGYDTPPGANVQGTCERELQTASATDCTGLIPALPSSEAELESYAQLYHYPADIFQD